jgi:hypothetical protein
MRWMKRGMQQSSVLTQREHHGWRRAAAGLSFALCLSGCAPALDWREVRPEGTALVAQLPCKPSRHVRNVELAGQRVDVQLMSCQAADITWAIAWIDHVDVRVTATLMQAWRQASLRNVSAENTAALSIKVPGATPRPDSGHWRSVGRRVDGTPLHQELLLFSHGTQVFQITVLSPRLSAVEMEPLLSGLRIRT